MYSNHTFNKRDKYVYNSLAVLIKKLGFLFLNKKYVRTSCYFGELKLEITKLEIRK